MSCSHQWIDPTEPPIGRATYSPVVGPLRREMKPGRRYVCQNCGAECVAPAPRSQLADDEIDTFAQWDLSDLDIDNPQEG